MNDPLLCPILLSVCLVALTAVCALAYSALESMNAAKVKSDAEDGDKTAAALAEILDEPKYFLLALQILTTLSACVSAAFLIRGCAAPLANACGVTSAPGKALLALALAFVLGLVLLVFGMLLPYRLAARRPEKTAKYIFPVVRALSCILHPLSWLVSQLVTGILKLFRINEADDSENLTEEEIRMMLDESEEEGLIESAEGEMIDNIFEFNNIEIYDVMTHRVDVRVIDIEEDREAITEIIRTTGYSRFPVYEGEPDHIIGLLYVKDFFLNADTPLRELLKEPIYVPDTMICDDLFRKMQGERKHFAIVTDEYGSFLGIITLEDLLEEIVGNIYDEYDKKREYILPNADGSWSISGRAELKDIEKALGLELPEQEDFNTLGGLVLSVTSEIPRDGTQFDVEVDGLHIKVLRVHDRRIEETRVTILEKPEEE